MKSAMLSGVLLLATCLAMPAAGQDAGPAARPGGTPPEVEAGRTPSPPAVKPPPQDARGGSGTARSDGPFEGSGDAYGPPDGVPGGSVRTPEDVGGSAGGSAGSFTGSDQRSDGKDGERPAPVK